MTEPSGLRDLMSEQPSNDPFEECELSPDAILGTHTFEDVLFTDETETPVNVLNGETPAHSQTSVDEARVFAAGIDSDTPHIALPASVEAQIRTANQTLHSCCLLPLQGDRVAQATSCIPPPITRIRSQLSSRPTTRAET